MEGKEFRLEGGGWREKGKVGDWRVEGRGWRMKFGELRMEGRR